MFPFLATFLWTSLCLCPLTLHLRLLLGRLRSKPPVRVTLIDLTGCGVAKSYHGMVTAVAVAHWLMALESPVPEVIAFPVAFAVDLSIYAFLAYLSAGAALQYAFLRLRSTYLAEGISDEAAHRAVAMAVFWTALLVAAVKIIVGNPHIFYYEMIGTKTEGISVFGLYLQMGFGGINLTVNLVLRFLIRREKKKAAAAMGIGQEKNQSNLEFKHYLAACCGMLALLLTLWITNKVFGTRHKMVRLVLLGPVCTLAPAWSLYRDVGLRHFAYKEYPTLKRVYEAMSGNKVQPQQQEKQS